MKKSVHEGQNLFDVAISYYGDPAEGIMQLWRDNPDIDILNEPMVPGLELVIDEAKQVNRDVVNFFKADPYRNVATGNEPAEGIGGEVEGIFDFSFDFTFE